MQDDGPDLCAVCMEPLHSRPHACMPGCRHHFHVSCMLNCFQYSPRCPVCRSVAEGVTPRVDVTAEQSSLVVATPSPSLATMVLDMEELEEGMRRMQESARREWRRYTDRRRRLLRRQPRLLERVDRLHELRVAMDREYEDASRIYERKCREVWRADPDVRTHRDALSRLRRRERRMHRSLEAELEAILGPEPN